MGPWGRIGDLPSGAIEAPQLAALEDAIELRALSLSPALLGTPTAPTAAPGTNSDQIATTAFVKVALDALIAAAPGAMDTLNELAEALGDGPNFANAIAGLIGTKAPLNNAPLTGAPTAPAPLEGEAETCIAAVKTVKDGDQAIVATLDSWVAPETGQSTTSGRIVAGWKHGKHLALGFDEATGETLIGGMRLGAGAAGLLQVLGAYLAGGTSPEGRQWGVAGPQWLEDDWAAFPVPGPMQSGAAQNVHYNGVRGHYDVEIPTWSAPVPLARGANAVGGAYDADHLNPCIRFAPHDHGCLYAGPIVAPAIQYHRRGAYDQSAHGGSARGLHQLRGHLACARVGLGRTGAVLVA